jgi:hypothetical protein
MPSSVGKQHRQQKQQHQHIYGMFSGATIKVTSNFHDPQCINERGSSSDSRLVESANGCWQREAISLSEHLSGVTQVLLLMHAASDATIERHLQPITRHT